LRSGLCLGRLPEAGDQSGEHGFAACGGVPVHDAFGYGFIDDGLGLIEKLNRQVEVILLYGCGHF